MKTFFDLINEVEMVGLKGIDKAKIGSKIATGAAKIAVDGIPGLSSAATIVGTIRDIINLVRSGKNAESLIVKLLQTKDSAQGVPANAFDLEDEFAELLSPKALEKIAAEVQQKLEELLKQSKKPTNNNFANKVAYNYMMRFLSRFRNQIT